MTVTSADELGRNLHERSLAETLKTPNVLSGSFVSSQRELLRGGYAAFDLDLRGTLAPFFRASESPIAMACLRLFTFPPLPRLPERSVPLFLRRIALATVLLAPLL